MRGLRANWHEKSPRGTLWRLMEVTAANGSLEGEEQSGILRDTMGTLYRKDRPRATFEAPVIEARKQNNLLVAPAGIVLHSVTPPGWTVRAKRAIWHADTNKILVEGNITIEHFPPGATKPTASGVCQQLTIDTDLKSVTIP